MCVSGLPCFLCTAHVSLSFIGNFATFPKLQLGSDDGKYRPAAPLPSPDNIVTDNPGELLKCTDCLQYSIVNLTKLRCLKKTKWFNLVPFRSRCNGPYHKVVTASSRTAVQSIPQCCWISLARITANRTGFGEGSLNALRKTSVIE